MIVPQPHSEGFWIAVRAQPGAKKNGVQGERAGALKVSVTTAPERGKANEAIADVLAEALNLRSSQVEIISGQTNREKKFLIRGIGLEELTAKLNELVAESD